MGMRANAHLRKRGPEPKNAEAERREASARHQRAHASPAWMCGASRCSVPSLSFTGGSVWEWSARGSAAEKENAWLEERDGGRGGSSILDHPPLEGEGRRE
jgi:hypothetical protein